MEVSKRRGSVVAAGSVWESRMKSDEVRGGIKVFKAGGGGTNTINVNKLRRSSTGSSPCVSPPPSSGKRKTWKSEAQKNNNNISEDDEKSVSSSCDGNGIKKSPIHTRKLLASSPSPDKVERSPIVMRKVRSEERNNNNNNSGQLRKLKSDPIINDNASSDDSIQLRKTTTESVLDPAPDEPRNEVVGDDESCKDLDADVCQEKEILSSTSSSENVIDHNEADEEEEEVMENERFEVKEISIPEAAENNNSVDLKNNETEPQEVVVVAAEPKKVVSVHMRFHHRNERPPSVPHVVKQSPTIRRNSTIYQKFSQPNSIPKAEEEHYNSSFPQTQSKLQSLVDLIMWRDVSRSAFIFGIGTFTIISSSYAKDINLSLISAVSYVGLVYLAVIFLYRSLICRGVINVVDSNYVVGEEDAIWILKLILPYLNEFLSKLKALFSGDPGTTMKLAVLLFVLARCGSFITIWKMMKLGFFGVFTVPKICSSYSAQLTAYGNFWIRRFRDAWDSCTHKKAVALAIFGLVWNLSSVIARIWAVFVLFVAFRYYQQHYMGRDEWVEDEQAEAGDETWQEPVRHNNKQAPAANFVSNNNIKLKKGF